MKGEGGGNANSPEVAPNFDHDLSDEATIERILSEYLQTQAPVLETISRQTGFRFRFGKETAFDHKNKEVIIGIPQLERFGAIADAKILNYLIYHELGHFEELCDDPDGYLQLIEGCEKDKKDGRSKFGLYNSLMDIYVNTNAANKAAVYREGEGFSDDIHKLYEEGTFNRRSISERVAAKQYPLHKQFSGFLLNEGMGVGESFLEVASPEIQDLVQQGLKMYGQNVSFSEFIKKYLLPPTEKEKMMGISRTISQRQEAIDRWIMPIYLKLLEQDRTNGYQEPLEGTVGEGDGDGNREMEVWREVAKGAKKQAGKSEEDKAKDRNKKNLENIFNQTGEKDFEDFYRRYEKMTGISNQLKALWRRICHVDTHEEVNWSDEYYKTGQRLSVPQAVRQAATLFNNPDEAKVFERRIWSEAQDIMPKKFKLSLLIDESGSMEGSLGGVRNFLVAIGRSLSEFNIENTLDSSLNGETPQATLEVYGFADELNELLVASEKISIHQVMEIYSKTQADGGTSAMSDGLKKIQSTTDAMKLSSGEDVHILLVVTDGDDTKVDEDTVLVQELTKMGVVTGGLFIGEAESTDEGGEVSNFRKIFPKQLGRELTSAQDLPAAVEGLIKEILAEESEI